MTELAFPPEAGPIGPAWWAPLEQAVERVGGDPRYPFLDIDDFMLMYRAVRRSRPDVYAYKHRFIRRYLHLDAEVRAYRWVPFRNPDRHGGRYLRHRRLRDAFDHLDLWELPWLKPGLEAYQQGLSWEEREPPWPPDGSVAGPDNIVPFRRIGRRDVTGRHDI